MSNSQYRPVESFSPLQGEVPSYFASPESYSHPWPGAEGDPSYAAYEMRDSARMGQPPKARNSSNSFPSYQASPQFGESGGGGPPLPQRPVPIQSYSSSSTLFPTNSQYTGKSVAAVPHMSIC